MKEYSPGDHSSGVDAYVFEVPNGVVPGIPEGWETETFGDVLRNLASWFQGETEESVRDRIRQVWFNPIHFPHRRSL
jgi:hypothetical protein